MLRIWRHKNYKGRGEMNLRALYFSVTLAHMFDDIIAELGAFDFGRAIH